MIRLPFFARGLRSARGLAVSGAASYTLASGVEVSAFGSVNGADPDRTACARG